MKRRTFISLTSVMAAAGVLSLSGCSSSNNTAASTAGTAASRAASAGGDLLSTIQNRGTLIVAFRGGGKFEYLFGAQRAGSTGCADRTG